jgi:hypothetical protein
MTSKLLFDVRMSDLEIVQSPLVGRDLSLLLAVMAALAKL